MRGKLEIRVGPARILTYRASGQHLFGVMDKLVAKYAEWFNDQPEDIFKYKITTTFTVTKPARKERNAGD